MPSLNTRKINRSKKMSSLEPSMNISKVKRDFDFVPEIESVSKSDVGLERQVLFGKIRYTNAENIDKNYSGETYNKENGI